MGTRREKSKPQRAVLDKQLEEVATKTVKAPNLVTDKLSDFCFHVAELIIGGVILAGLMNQELDYTLLALLGFFAVILFVLMGIYFAKISK